MTNSNLTVINYQGCKVLTIKQLAMFYDVTTSSLKAIYERDIYDESKSIFKKGVDYYLLEGEDLKNFKRKWRYKPVIYETLVHPLTTKLYLWTARGARKLSKFMPEEKRIELKNIYFDIPMTTSKVEREEISLIANAESEVLASSRNVASRLERRHTKILADIGKLLATNNEEETAKNFRKQTFNVPTCRIPYPEFLMTQSGFLLLTSRYRSANAKTVRDEYIQAFKEHSGIDSTL